METDLQDKLDQEELRKDHEEKVIQNKKESDLRDQSILEERDKIIKEISQAQLFGRSVDMENPNEVLVCAFYLGAKWDKIQKEKKRFQYTRPQKKK